MKKGTIILIVVVLAILAFAGTFVGQYNALVAMDEGIRSAEAEIDVQLQRRMELIPNLVATVKGYTAHEESILTAIADARAKMAGAGSTGERLAASDELSGALSRLLVVVENYPNLKADTQFTNLTDELAGTENRIAVARGRYNNSVETFNRKIRTFPASVTASLFGFEKADYLAAPEGAATAPKVEF
jgi:LemA protein